MKITTQQALTEHSTMKSKCIDEIVVFIRCSACNCLWIPAVTCQKKLAFFWLVLACSEFVH